MRKSTAPLAPWLVAAFALVVGSCTSGVTDPNENSATSATSTEPPSTTTSASTTITPTTTTTTLDPVLAEPLPVDPDVVSGTLDNGLHYFIRFNDAPGGRAELRLAVDAGSLYEDSDQAGAAHFLEHMMFNGTERFPRNELTALLESFGPRFGPDINASTSFDETLYDLSVPAEDALLDLGVEVLREWASEATNTPTDVIEERGVVLEEWRLRDQGLEGRVSALYQDLLLTGTPYEGKAPIGASDSIQSTSPEALERFYRDWYRPDRMAVIAVGDFDLDDMEARIVTQFGALQGQGEPRPAPDSGGAPENVIRAGSLVDPEVALASIDVLWPREAAPATSVGDREDDYVLLAAMSMLATRLNNDSLRGKVPLLNASNLRTDFNRAFSLLTLNAQARPASLPDALEVVAEELARVRAHGFSDQEFDRAIQELKSSVDIAYDSRDSTQDKEHAAALVAHYLADAPLMSASQRFEVDTGILKRMTKDAVETAFVEFLDATAPRVVVVAPDNGDPVPDVEEIEKVFTDLENRSAGPHEDIPELDALMRAPRPVEETSFVVDEDLGFATVTWENGATAMLWPNTIAEGMIWVEITSFGGTSTVAVEDVPEAQLAAGIVSRSGLGPADAAVLQLFLADRFVNASPWISETREGISAGAATQDAEAMMQMIHLLMTEPRFDEVAVGTVLAEYEAQDATRVDVPSLAAGDELVDAYYSGDPRYFTIPSAAQLAEFDADRALAIFRERFANAGDFVFAIVGDFDPQTMLDLAGRYVGTLPGSPEREDFVDHQPLPPREIQLRTVMAGTDPQGELQLFFTNELDPTAKDRLTGRVMELIVNARLRDRIREELSATYSPSAGVSLQRDPDPFIETNVIVTGDPERLEAISVEVLADLADLVASGPSAAEFSTALQQLRTEMELISNEILANALTTSFLYPDQPATELLERYMLVEEITGADVQRMARIAYNPNQRIEIRVGQVSP